MPSEMSVRAVHHGGMRVTATAGSQVLEMDYPLHRDDPCAGWRPLEVLLASLAGCSANTLALLLRRTDQAVSGIDVNARGTRRDGHPTLFTDIVLDFAITGTGLNREAIERALATAEEYLCPVWAMLKDKTRITTSYRIVDAPSA